MHQLFCKKSNQQICIHNFIEAYSYVYSWYEVIWLCTILLYYKYMMKKIYLLKCCHHYNITLVYSFSYTSFYFLSQIKCIVKWKISHLFFYEYFGNLKELHITVWYEEHTSIFPFSIYINKLDITPKLICRIELLKKINWLDHEYIYFGSRQCFLFIYL